MKILAQRDGDTFLVQDKEAFIQLSIGSEKVYVSRRADTFFKSDDWDDPYPEEGQEEKISDIVDKINKGAIKPRYLV